MTADFLKKTNLYLIGMMGAGKTTIGRKLANRLGYRFLDTDALIEQTAKKPITQIFAEEGEAAFRQLETQVLAQVAKHTSVVIATGGGIITQQMNWSYLRHGVVIWLDVPVPVLISRLSNDTHRPLLNVEPDVEPSVALGEKLNSLIEARGDRYAQADIRIAYEGRSVGKTCDRIVAALQQSIRPDPKLIADEVIVSQSSINPPANLQTIRPEEA